MLGIDGTVTRQSHRAGALRLRRAGQLAEREPRLDLLPAADDLRRRLQRPGLQHLTVPHTVRTKETKSCTDCHVSRDQRQQRLDGAAAAAGHQLRQLHGPLRLRRRRRKSGFDAVAVTEHDEPQAVIGSYLQKIAYPDNYTKHLARHRELDEAYHHAGSDVLDVQAARRVSLRRQGQGRLPRLRRRQHRQQGLLRAHDHRAGLAARPALLSCRRSTPTASPRRPRWASIRCAPTPRRTKSSPSTCCTASSTWPTSTRAW